MEWTICCLGNYVAKSIRLHRFQLPILFSSEYFVDFLNYVISKISLRGDIDGSTVSMKKWETKDFIESKQLDMVLDLFVNIYWMSQIRLHISYNIWFVIWNDQKFKTHTNTIRIAFDLLVLTQSIIIDLRCGFCISRSIEQIIQFNYSI